MKFHWFGLDWHTLTHLLGSYALARVFSHIPDFTMLNAAILAFLLGVAHEAMDEYFKGQWIYDPRGWSLDDIVFDLIGCTSALWI